MRDIHPHGIIPGRKNSRLHNFSPFVEEDYPQSALQEEYCLILLRINMAVRRNIRAGFYGIKQPVT